ncbi:hypothetical protein BOX15_Mlig024777g3, partial [Macrostomum lignano]
ATEFTMKESEPGNIFARLYFKYLVETSIYMLEPYERIALNCLVVVLLLMSAYTSWLFLPHHTVSQHLIGIVSSLIGWPSPPAAGDLAS